jgi:colicin import membrane protein
MFRTHESAIAWKAGWLALLVHVLLLGALIFSFNWKAAHTVVAVSEVELWDALPSESKPAPKPKPKVKEIPKIKPPEPVEEPKVIEPKIEEPKVEAAKPEVDIALEQKKKEEEQKKKEAEKLAEQKKKDLAKLQKELLEEPDAKEAVSEDLKKLQAEMRGEAAKPTLAASQGVVNEYVAKIKAKIHGNLNRALCGDGNPELVFKVNLLPNGEFLSEPRLTKSSGNTACDGAVERAIIASEPFPLPPNPDAFAEFRNLNLNFKPNAQ